MLTLDALKKLDHAVRLADCTTASEQEVFVEKAWDDNVVKSTVTNRSGRPLRIKEVVLFSGETSYSPDTPFYGEGYQMLTQYSGTLSEPYHIGAYGTDWDFFRLPRTKFHENVWSVYNLLLLSPENQGHQLLAFTSCHRFSGEIRFRGSYIEVIMDTEDLTLEPGASWDLESFVFSSGPDHNELLLDLAGHLNRNHPRKLYPEIPTGWCSYYCLRPMTAEGFYENARAMKERIPELKRIQIDGGYAAYNGDFLIPRPGLGADVKTISDGIRANGMEAAGYLSPFIVQPESNLRKEHPEWLVKDEEGNPYNGIGQKKKTPDKQWYMLDTTHPGAVNYLRTVVRTMHDEWGWRYFKMDFLQYGALPGIRYDKNATRIEAFRRGIQAIADEVGHDSFLLGCNAPFWPLLGLVHGNRITNDIARDWKHVGGNAREQFPRNWQNDTLWYNDPDVVVLERVTFKTRNISGELVDKPSIITDQEFEFHKAVILASGGMIISGDLIPKMSEKNINVLKKLLPPTGKAASFDDTGYTIGRIDLGDKQVVCVFNFDEEPKDFEFAIPGSHRLYDFWTDEEFGEVTDKVHVPNLDGHCAKVLYYFV
ncbi:alpha-galactosidase [Paenibacillus sp. H1-7]|uniref:glycoside hydrolase family 36 protein n=1 Tax=Paenibacillus sp. H1-7 TaxID=2282849 RepID=UPI001EF8BE26|nr:glycoside hydrolase family 36 protein [Paenibacillus sp. H1-7]ULL16034.1 alpha-galactosidase [Paenibacillus sp. H1-7]